MLRPETVRRALYYAIAIVAGLVWASLELVDSDEESR